MSLLISLEATKIFRGWFGSIVLRHENISSFVKETANGAAVFFKRKVRIASKWNSSRSNDKSE